MTQDMGTYLDQWLKIAGRGRLTIQHSLADLRFRIVCSRCEDTFTFNPPETEAVDWGVQRWVNRHADLLKCAPRDEDTDHLYDVKCKCSHCTKVRVLSSPVRQELIASFDPNKKADLYEAGNKLIPTKAAKYVEEMKLKVGADVLAKKIAELQTADLEKAQKQKAQMELEAKKLQIQAEKQQALDLWKLKQFQTISPPEGSMGIGGYATSAFIPFKPIPTNPPKLSSGASDENGVYIDGKFVPWIKDAHGNIIGLDPSNRQVALTRTVPKIDKPVPPKSGRKFR